MTNRITSEVIKITEVEGEPHLDSAKIAGIAVLDGEDWEFRTKLENLETGDVIQAVIERTETAEGQYLRIHEKLKSENN